MAKNNYEVTDKGVTSYGVAWVEVNGHRFIDFNDPKTCERVGTKNLLPIKPEKFNESTFRAFKDPAHDLWFGIRTGWDKDGNPIFRKIKITAARYYNLELPVDAMEYTVVKHHESVKGSKFERGRPFLYVEDPEEEANMKAERIISAVKPVELAATLHGTKLKNFARVMGVVVKDNSEVIVKGMLLEKAQKDPAGFMDKWENTDRDVLEILLRAVEYGVITNDNIKGYMYKNAVPMGNNRLAAISFLKQDKPLLSAIELECEDIASKALAPSKAQEMQPISESAQEKELRLLRAKIAELESKPEVTSQEEERGETFQPEEPAVLDEGMPDLAMYYRGLEKTKQYGRERNL
jgi:hypothetical protein